MVLEILQRTAVVGLVTLLPKRRDRILGGWQRWIARSLLGLVTVVGGAKLGPLPTIPGRSGVLILMNHQSVIDIPLMVASLDDLYPKIVTRARYAGRTLLISHMLRLYQYPLVDSRATVGGRLRELEDQAKNAQIPMAIFPEGSRSRDGTIGRFKRLGLEAILRSRRWEVYILVADGFWKAATLNDFTSSISEVVGRVCVLGPFDSPEPDGPFDGFVQEMQERMEEALEEMRRSVPE